MTGKKILALGSGRISRPCIQYLLKKGHKIVLVDISEENIKRTLDGHPGGISAVADATAETGSLIREYKPDAVVCLLPKVFMADAAKACVDAGVSMVGASYAPDEVNALDKEARQRGVTILCEVGLDPGIDHMSAVSKIRECKAKNGVIESFWSVCGALPDIGSNTNPMGYKLSWAPASLIGASVRSARIMTDGKVTDLPDGTTYQHPSFHEISSLGWFEVYANANSLPYIEAYEIPETRSIYRGTLRYPGWCDMVTQMQKLGLFDETRRNFAGKTVASVIREITGTKDQSVPAIDCAAKYLNLETHSLAIKKLEWLGMFDESAPPIEQGSMRDIVSALYGEKLVFSEGERDLVVMQHRLGVSYPGNSRKTHISTLVSRGDFDTESAIAKTTGLPIGIAAHLIVIGAIKRTGVVIPTTEDIYIPSMKELSVEGICFTEETIDRN